MNPRFFSVFATESRACAKYISQVLPIIKLSLVDSSAGVRRNAAFCAGTLAQGGGEHSVDSDDDFCVVYKGAHTAVDNRPPWTIVTLRGPGVPKAMGPGLVCGWARAHSVLCPLCLVRGGACYCSLFWLG